MRQPGGADHQRQREQHHVQRRTVVAGVVVEAQLAEHLVELGQQRQAGFGVGGEQAQLRQRVASELQRDEHRLDGVGNDQHAVLRELGVGDALHAAEHRVDEHHR